MSKAREKFEGRRIRTRASLRRKNNGRIRLSVHRTGLHIYAQIIDDVNGVTLASASSLSKDFDADGGNKDGAKKVGEQIAKNALAKGIKNVVFDRGGYLYHGRVKELADGAREGGLSFENPSNSK